MQPIVIAAVVVLLVVIAFLIYRARRKPGCATNADCTPPATCVDGTCQPPAACQPPCVSPKVCVNGSCVNPPPQSCYEWSAWTPATQKGTPPWLIGAALNGYMVPVGATDGTNYYVGGTVGDSTAHDYGTFYYGGGNPSVQGTLYGVQATGACPTKFSSTADPTKALQFHGTPVCWDFGGVSNVFVPYQDGACAAWSGMGSFQLVADAYDT